MVRCVTLSVPHHWWPHYPKRPSHQLFWRANNSMRGTSPISLSIRSLTSSGFLLCSSTWEIMTWWTSFDCRFGWPLTASKQVSALARVQCPIPQKSVSDTRLSFTHTKATVRKLNPHAFITPHASWSIGNVIQRNNAQSFAANWLTGSALM